MNMDSGIGSKFLGGRVALAGAMLLAVSGTLGIAQDASGGTPPPPMQANRPPMERAFHGGPGRGMMGRWWDNPKVSAELNLQADQKQKLDEIFQQSRLKLIDLHASLQKREAELEPLMEADAPEESKVLAKIDTVAQARAELEKSNARMLLSMRQVLTAEQWTKLKAARAERMGHEGHGPGMMGGPGGGPGGAAGAPDGGPGSE